MNAFIKTVWVYLNDPQDAYTRLECIRDFAVFGCFVLSLYGLSVVASTFVIP